MKRDSIQMALLLAGGCVALRLLGEIFPSLVPNASPLMALALVSGLYFPRRWGWLVALAVAVVTELAMIPYSMKTVGIGFPWWALASLPLYVVASGLGVLIAPAKSLGKIGCGSIALSVLFYVAANTFSWAMSILFHITPGYPASFAGWLQANWSGVPGYPPAYLFLRNGVLGDLFFVFVFVAILDRQLLLAPFTGRTAASAARSV